MADLYIYRDTSEAVIGRKKDTMAQLILKTSKVVYFMSWGYSVNAGYTNVPSPRILSNTDIGPGHEELFLF